MGESLLEVRHLRTYFYMDAGVVKAVDGVDFSVAKGRSLGIVGESGCGKSVTAQSIMQIVPQPQGRIVGGEILLHTSEGIVDIAKLSSRGKKIRSLRGREVSMVFQEPMNSLSPVHTIGSQITEGIREHEKVSRTEAREKAIEMLAKVRIARPREVVGEYPYMLSGGMRQRAMIALALACGPSLLIADEPTTALDVTVQAQILKLIRDLQDELGMGLILITHALGVIAQTTDTVAVFYLGRVVEYGDIKSVFLNPLHPYTQALFVSIPKLETTGRLKPIAGSVPDPYAVMRGCPFRDRCEKRFARCEEDVVPELIEVEQGHSARCFLYGQERQ